MRRLRERLIVGVAFICGPVLFYFGVVSPWKGRVDAIHVRTEEATRAFPGPFIYIPISRAERAALADPKAPWAHRLPVVVDDQARLAHYDRVVSEFQRVLKEGGAPVAGIRSSWDAIRGSYTLPSVLAGAGASGPQQLDAPELTVRGWVLEARLEGPTAQLFKAIRLAQKADPLLEPVGFRWNYMPGNTRVQHLVVRNQVLVP